MTPGSLSLRALSLSLSLSLTLSPSLVFSLSLSDPRSVSLTACPPSCRLSLCPQPVSFHLGFVSFYLSISLSRVSLMSNQNSYRCTRPATLQLLCSSCLPEKRLHQPSMVTRMSHARPDTFGQLLQTPLVNRFCPANSKELLLMHRSKELLVGEISVIPLRSAQSRNILESAGASSSATVTRQTHAACKTSQPQVRVLTKSPNYSTNTRTCDP